MGTALKTVSADDLHITLKFLGETQDEQLSAITTTIDEIAAGFTPFSMELVGLGAFPRIERPSVIWAGVQSGKPLIDIAAQLEDRLMDLGFEPESRPFSPHLTIARVRRKPPQSLHDLFARHESTRFATISVNSLTFYESILSPDGPQYHALATAVLGNGEP